MQMHWVSIWAIQGGQEIGQLRRKRIEIEEAKEIAFPSATKTSSKGRPYLELKKTVDIDFSTTKTK